MERGHQLVFGSFHLDPIQKRLWQGAQEIALQARPLAVLHYFLTHPGRVISKEELLKQVWAGTYVTKTALQVCVRAIREALGDKADAPQYLETVGREGYRWIGAVQGSGFRVQGSDFDNPQLMQSPIVGRERELTQLHAWLDMAREGHRQVVFIAGEPGIGKTTAVDVFLDRLRAEGTVRIGRGQCMEQYGEGEAYLPVLEALAQVCRAPGGQQVIDILSRYAPTWLVQMPALIEESVLAALQQRVAGVTRERMLREMADALEALTAERGLVLVCEDLHASDRSTVELIAYLAQRRELARLLIIGTYRPATIVVKEHPLSGIVRELRVHHQCQELRLELLTETDVTEYLAVRLPLPSPLAGEGQDGGELGASRAAGPLSPGSSPGQALPLSHEGRGNLKPNMQAENLKLGLLKSASPLREVAQQVHDHTEGNPLFLVNMVAYLLRQGMLREVEGQWQLVHSLTQVGLPESLQQMIEQQVKRLTPQEQRVLEVASVQGYEFDAAIVAKALALEAAEVEERLAELERGYALVRLTGEEEFPDHTFRLRYRFVHVLYQNALYNALTPTRKAQWSRAVAQALVGHYGDKSETVAGELAHLYKTAREYGQAADYYLLAAQHALQVVAHAEAMALAGQGLEALNALPDSPHRRQHELTLQVTLAGAVSAARGFAVPETGAIYARARALAQQMEDSPQLLSALRGLSTFYNVRGEYRIAREVGEQMLGLAQRLHDPTALVFAHAAVAEPLLYLGEFAAARAHFEQGMACDNPQQRQGQTRLDGWDDAMLCRSSTVCLLWCLGYAEQALQRLDEVLTAAREESSRGSHNLMFALLSASWVHLFRREGHAGQKWAEALMALATEQEFPFWVGQATLLRGWALVEQGQGEDGITQLRQGLSVFRAIGMEVVMSQWLALLAEACGKVGRSEEGLAAMVEALAVVDKTGERRFEAEMWRIKGQLRLQQGTGQENQKSKGKNQKAKMTNPQPLTSNPHAEAEACFHQAITIACQQQAKFWQLRATVSLSRLWQSQGKTNEAHKALSAIYDWFTEGFDTVDLQEAQVLLEELEK